MKLWAGKSFKNLLISVKKSGGRNVHGRITTRHIGGGHRRKVRIITFNRSFEISSPSWIKRFEYCPSRSGVLSLLVNKDGDLSYVLSTLGTKIGQMVGNGLNFELVPGTNLPLTHTPPGTMLHSLNFKNSANSGVARAAGTSVQVLRRFNNKYTLVRLPSGEKRLFQSNLWAIVGSVLPVSLFQPESKFKAGSNRWRGIRPCKSMG
jgi:large subunit ribosomal protein L2